MRTDPLPTSLANALKIPGEAPLGLRDTAYIESAKPVFEDLKQIVNQLAGLLLVSQAVSRHGFAARDLLSRSHELLADARHAFDVLRPGIRCGHHHRHMCKAIDALAISMMAAQEAANGLKLGDRGFRALKVAWRELSHASNALPGFERVDLSQSCCAQHFVKSSQPNFSCQGVVP